MLLKKYLRYSFAKTKERYNVSLQSWCHLGKKKKKMGTQVLGLPLRGKKKKKPFGLLVFCKCLTHVKCGNILFLYVGLGTQVGIK